MQLEAAIRLAVAAGDRERQKMGKLGREAYEAEFAIEIGVKRIENLLAGGGREEPVLRSAAGNRADATGSLARRA